MKNPLIYFLCVLMIVPIAFVLHEKKLEGDFPSTHGMLIMGKDAVYASHLPMFKTPDMPNMPHDYQVILKLKLDDASDKLFKRDQADHPQSILYTIAPETFVLPDMVAKPRPFKADLYRGHFERTGKVKIASVTITIEKVVLFKKFDPKASRMKEAKYLVFGSGTERFIAHIISQRPDFDHVMQVETTLAEGTEVTTNAKENSSLQGIGKTITVKQGLKDATIKLLKKIYLEFKELE
jgi:hypothetical protein